jgi:hypothetical protein
MMIPTKTRNQGLNEKDIGTEPDQETEWRNQAERKRDGEKKAKDEEKLRKRERKKEGEKERKKENKLSDRPSGAAPTRFPIGRRLIRGDGVEIIFFVCVRRLEVGIKSMMSQTITK